MTARLRRYWFQFHGNATEIGFGPGCGVTAWTQEDAIALLRAGPFHGRELSVIAAVTVDVDISSLDPGHVLPNMETPSQRGIWYPRGFS